jgi:hypothetical protein
MASLNDGPNSYKHGTRNLRRAITLAQALTFWFNPLAVDHAAKAVHLMLPPR